MRFAARWIASLCLLSFAALGARAEGLVQISIYGRIVNPGGAPIELELELWNGKEIDSLSLNLHLAQSTTARDLATLLVSRLERLKARVDFPGLSADSAATTVFIESVTAVSTRLGHGMRADITLCDSAPASVRFLPPQTQKGPAEIMLSVTTFQAHSRTIAQDTITLSVNALTSAAEISETLALSAIDEGWIADRPRPDSWACIKNTDGAMVTGCGVSLNSYMADWRVEVKLDHPPEANLPR